MKKLKILLLFSVTFNFLGLIAFIYIADKFGGFSYVLQRVTSGRQSDPYENRLQILSAISNKDKIVFAGDSLTEQGEWSEYFGNLNVVNRGISNDTTERLLDRIGDISEDDPDSIFLMIGINDLYKKKSAEEVFENYKKIIEQIRTDSPGTQIFVQEVLPTNDLVVKEVDNEEVWKLNELIATIDGVTSISLETMTIDGRLDPNITTDGIHLNADGYEKWKNILMEYIN